MSGSPEGVDFPDPAAALEISPQTVSALLAQRATGAPFLLLDCREEDEYALCKIQGSQLLPLSRFGELRPEHLPENRETPIVVYCHHGVRSMHATQFLRSQGHGRTFSMRGGIEAWSVEIDPRVPRY